MLEQESTTLSYYRLAQVRRRPSQNVRIRRWLIIALAVVVYLLAVGGTVDVLVAGQHTWGIHAHPTSTGAWQVTWSDDGLSADFNIQVGDQILQADGLTPQSEAEINQATQLQVYSPASHVQRSLRWNAPALFDGLLNISWIVVGFVSLLLGILVFLHATERALASRFFMLWTTMAVASSLVPPNAFGNLLTVHIADALIAIVTGLLLNFLWLVVVYTPRALARGRSLRHRWVSEIPILTGIVTAFLFLYSVTTEQPDLFQTALLVKAAQTAIALLLSILLLLWVSVSRQASMARERARTLLAGTLIASIPVLALSVLPQIIVGQPLVPGAVSAIVVTALPLSFAYAIVRRDLLRVDSLIRNTVLRLLTVIGMAIAAVLLAEVLNPLPNILALVLGVIAGALLVSLMLQAARWTTEAWLFPQVRRYRKLIASGERIERTGLNPQRLAEQLVGEVHLALPVRQVAVFVPDKHTGQLVPLSRALEGTKREERTGGTPASKISSPLQSAPEQHPLYQPLLLDDAATARLRRSNAPMLIVPAAADVSGMTQRSEEPWHLLIPMRLQGRLIGVLALSQREDEQSYSDTDLQLLRILASRQSLALDYSLLYADLHAAYEQRRELDAAKDRFIVTAHHELRTPLTAVQGYLELLRDLGPEGRNARPGDVEIFLEKACRSADELKEQLDSLLRAAEMTFSQTQIRLQPVAVNSVAQHATQTLEAQARRGNHRIHNQIRPDLLVLADENALYRIFMNLLSNSLKYSADGRPVLLDARLETEMLSSRNRAADAEGRPISMVRISVRDWGMGIHPKDKYKLFERFMRLERELNSPVRGSGLGLAICRELVTAMGGAIDVLSEGVQGAGSEFWFTLPLASVEEYR